MKKNIENELITLAKSMPWSCQLCGATGKLVNHHISYIPERILVVCPKCHSKIHAIYPDICPKIKRSDWLIVKRILYPAKLEDEKLLKKYEFIDNKLDLYKEQKMLAKEGKVPSDEEMKSIIRGVDIL